MKIKTSFEKVESVLDHCVTLSLTEKNLTKNGSKITYLGGGWWNVFGYSPGKAEEIIRQLREKQ